MDSLLRPPSENTKSYINTNDKLVKEGLKKQFLEQFSNDISSIKNAESLDKNFPKLNNQYCFLYVKLINEFNLVSTSFIMSLNTFFISYRFSTIDFFFNKLL